MFAKVIVGMLFIVAMIPMSLILIKSVGVENMIIGYTITAFIVAVAWYCRFFREALKK